MILGGIRTEDIIKSIDHNIEFNQYASKSIALKYVSAIAQFFRFAEAEHWFQNDNLKDDINAPLRFDDQSYRAKVTDYILKNGKLKIKESKDVLTKEEAIRLLTNIDEYLSPENFSHEAVSIERAAAMLAMKLMLFTGIKYNVAKDLLLTAVDVPTNSITINGFYLRMPIKFCLQVQEYLRMRNSFNCPYLFVDNSGNPWSKTTTTSKIPEIHKRFLGRTDTTGLTKYGISELLDVGTGISEIERLTSARANLIRGCMSNTGETEQEKDNRYINRQLCKMDIYYRI